MLKSRFVALAALCATVSIPSNAGAQNAYSVEGFGPVNQDYWYYYSVQPQVMNDAGDVAGYYYPNGVTRGFAYRQGVFTELTLGGTHSQAVDMNTAGAVVGYGYLPDSNVYHAFLFDGVMHDLGALNNTYSYAYGVNASGVVVGYSGSAAFRYQGGTMQALIDLLPAGSGWSYLYEARDINDAGQIVGRGYHNTLGYRGFLFTPTSGTSPASIVPLGDSNTTPLWINASGQVAGYSYNGWQQTFLFTPGAGGGTFTIIPTLGGSDSYPYDLNDAGHIVGGSRTATGYYHAFRYSNGQTVDLDPSPATAYSHSYAMRTNQSGVVVGYSNNGSFVYSNGVMRSVQSLVSGCNWSSTSSLYVAVNNAGQIAGAGYEPSVGYRGFIMTPLSGQLASTLTTNDAGGTYRQTTYLQARLAAGCSVLPGRTVAFALNGTAAGSAQTDSNGYATLPSASLGTIPAGTYPDGIVATFDGETDVTGTTDAATLYVNQAQPAISWNPAALVEGTPLGTAQLNANADTPGTFTYSPAAGTTLASGLRTLYTYFQPSDALNYYSVSRQVLLAVRASNPIKTLTAAEVPSLGGTYTEAVALSNTGHVTGYSYTAGNVQHHAFRFANGTTTDLGTLGGTYSYGADVNDAGQVTGWAYDANNRQRAFLYSGAAMVDIGSGQYTYDYSNGMAINASGDVAVYARGTSGYYRAFLYDASQATLTELGALNANRHTYPRDINNSRQVVGHSDTSACYHAFVADLAGITDLGTLGGQCSQATAINDGGQIVGWAYNSSNRTRAFLYANGQMTDLGTLGGDYSYASAISNDGVITGWSYTAQGYQHAFRYADGVMTDLGAINASSEGLDVNESGDIVGWTYTPEGQQTGALFSAGAVLDLNSLINVGETAGVNYARAINNPGQVLAQGQGKWYLLTPTTLASSSLALQTTPTAYRGTTTLTATLTAANPDGKVVQFSLNGTGVGSAIANAQGVATLEDVSVAALNAGTHIAAASAVFAGDAGYAGSTAAADLTIAKAPSPISWAQPGSIMAGTALSSVQLNASTAVPGTLTFTPAAGAILAAGFGQVLQVSFAPADPVNYEASTATVTIDVINPTPVITWVNPASIYYGTALNGTQLNASASVPGTFAYSPAAGTVLDASAAPQPLSVLFTPADSLYSTASAAVQIQVLKATPTINAAGGIHLFDGAAHPATGTVAGINNTPLGSPTFTYAPGGAAVPVNPGIYQATASYPGSGNYEAVSQPAGSVVINAAPAGLSVTGPTGPVALNVMATVSASFTDSATADTHTCRFTWDDGKPDTTTNLTSTQTACSASHAYTAAGVYVVGVTVTDDDGLSATATWRYVVVYDPNGGFVTGGGWIQSPLNAYLANPTLTGKATFGFVSKYVKGTTVPGGETEFEFQVAGFRFKSIAYEWLVVSGTKAQYKGIGAANDLAGYGFLLSASDGSPDKFRIKIWEIASGLVVYDNKRGSADDLATDPQAIGGGSIVIHSK